MLKFNSITVCNSRNWMLA